MPFQATAEAARFTRFSPALRGHLEGPTSGRDGNLMKQITLTQGQFALVDDADYDELSKFKLYLGTFPSVAEASAVYATANRHHFGEFGGGL